MDPPKHPESPLMYGRKYSLSVLPSNRIIQVFAVISFVPAFIDETKSLLIIQKYQCYSRIVIEAQIRPVPVDIERHQHDCEQDKRPVWRPVSEQE